MTTTFLENTMYKAYRQHLSAHTCPLRTPIGKFTISWRKIHARENRSEKFRQVNLTKQQIN